MYIELDIWGGGYACICAMYLEYDERRDEEKVEEEEVL